MAISILDNYFPTRIKNSGVDFSLKDFNDELQSLSKQNNKKYIVFAFDGHINQGEYYYARISKRDNIERIDFFSGFIDTNGKINSSEISHYYHDNYRYDIAEKMYQNIIHSCDSEIVDIKTRISEDFPTSIIKNNSSIDYNNAKKLLESYNRDNNTNYSIVAASLSSDKGIDENTKIGFDTYLAFDSRKSNANNILFLKYNANEIKWININESRAMLPLKEGLINSILPALQESINHTNDISNYGYHIYDYIQGAFWKPNSIGYTKDLSEVGFYSREVAERNLIESNITNINLEIVSCHDNDRLWKLQRGTKKDFPVRNKTPINDILEPFTKSYFQTNPLGKIEDALNLGGHYVKPQFYPHVDYEKRVSVKLELQHGKEDINVSLYRMPSGSYEVVAYPIPKVEVSIENKQSKTQKLK